MQFAAVHNPDNSAWNPNGNNDVAQTSKSAVSQVSKPAQLHRCGCVTRRDSPLRRKKTTPPTQLLLAVQLGLR